MNRTAKLHVDFEDIKDSKLLSGYEISGFPHACILHWRIHKTFSQKQLIPSPHVTQVLQETVHKSSLSNVHEQPSQHSVSPLNWAYK